MMEWGGRIGRESRMDDRRDIWLGKYLHCEVLIYGGAEESKGSGQSERAWVYRANETSYYGQSKTVNHHTTRITTPFSRVAVHTTQRLVSDNSLMMSPLSYPYSPLILSSAPLLEYTVSFLSKYKRIYVLFSKTYPQPPSST